MWRFLDGKPGHENQTAGLLQALAELVPIEVHTLVAEAALAAIGHWMCGRFPAGQGLPTPGLLVGAGHATHLPMLAARRACGGRIVVLMKPSLPCRWFDACMIPEHDSPRQTQHIFVTQGALNRIQPSRNQDPSCGLLLVGGPSRHHEWQEAPLLEAIAELLVREPQRSWQLGTSRRTPESFLAALRGLAESLKGALEIVPWQQAHPDWLSQQLARAGVVWVTADSVSMLYEALTAGAQVGVLPVPERHPSRVSKGLQALLHGQRIVDLVQWRAQGYAAPQKFNEAQRGACWIRDRWLNNA